MGPMQSEDVRRRFVRYFEGLGHLSLPSASLVVHRPDGTHVKALNPLKASKKAAKKK